MPLIGQGSVRAGIAGYDPRPFTPEQIERELAHVREAMEGGAFGGSFGFLYEPDRYAKMEEILAFAKEIAKYDGIVTIHPRACSIVSADYPLLTKKSHLELGLDEAVEIMENSSAAITVWDESTIRQLVDWVKILSTEEILVCLHGGIEIKQRMEQ